MRTKISSVWLNAATEGGKTNDARNSGIEEKPIFFIFDFLFFFFKAVNGCYAGYACHR